VGDRLYGNADGLAEVDLQLCSVLLGFVCPVAGVEREYELSGEFRPQL